MPSFFKRLVFHLKGGIPSTSKFEARRTALAEKREKYLALKQTPDLLRYQDLAVQLATPRSQSGLPKKEWKAMRQEFSALRKSAQVSEFFKLQKSSRNFQAITRWEMVFEDDFTEQSLNADKWAMRPPMLPNALEAIHSSSDEGHVYTDGANVALANSTLKIMAKHEKAAGLGFSNTIGFLPIEREYTSGVVSAVQSQAQPHGKIEVRLSFNLPAKGIYHAIWLGAGKMLPHVNVLRIGPKLEFSAFADTQQKESYVDKWPRSLLRQNAYYIVAVEWNSKEMVWSINGAKIFSAPNVMNNPMYITFSSGVAGKPSKMSQASMEIDWVKVYKYNNEVVL